MEEIGTSKIAIVGHGRHGKDLAAEILSQITYLRYGGSASWAALPFIANWLNIHPQMAWENRHKHRNYWYEACNFLRKDDPCFLIKRVLRDGDMVVGIRDKVEIQALKESKLVKEIIWVDASKRVPEKDPTVNFTAEDCTMVLDNNSGIDSLYLKVYCLAQHIGLPLRAPDFLTCLKLIELDQVPDTFSLEREEP